MMDDNIVTFMRSIGIEETDAELLWRLVAGRGQRSRQCKSGLFFFADIALLSVMESSVQPSGRCTCIRIDIYIYLIYQNNYLFRFQQAHNID